MGKSSAREYAILYVGGKGKSSGPSIGGGNAILNAGQHALDGPEHRGASDDTRLDASTGAHGLLPKLSGDGTDRLDGDGVFRPVPADEVPYDNATSGLVAAFAQSAIDELATLIGTPVLAASDLTTRFEPHVAYDGTVVLDGSGDPVMVEVAN